jgi:hypothetical protein
MMLDRISLVVLMTVGACGEDDSPPAAPVDAAQPSIGWRNAAPVAAISSPTSEQTFPTVRGDGLELIFASNRSGGAGCTDLWHSTRTTSTGVFDAPVPIAGMNTSGCEGSPNLRADGLELIFVMGPGPTSKLFHATRPSIADAWDSPTEVTALNINGFQISPSLSADGLTILFQSAAMGMANAPVFQAERTSTDAEFGAPHALTELASAQLGVGLSADGLSVITSEDGQRLETRIRSTISSPLNAAVTIDELVPNPSYPNIGQPFLTRDGSGLYYVRRNDMNHVEIWSASSAQN